MPNKKIKRAKKKKAKPGRRKPVSTTGSLAANLHEGSRSEYLAHFVFSSFGTAIPVPHQEDTGLDIYCTLLERVGHRAWPRSYYAVQVKSTMEPWVFEGSESLRWIIRHPLPIFLCIVQKSEARILVYQTCPRFAAWTLEPYIKRLELILGTETKGQTVEGDFVKTDAYYLRAPILNFTIQELLDDEVRARVRKVLEHWIEYDLANLARIKNGLPRLWVPHDYETNSTKFSGWAMLGGPFREDQLTLVQNRLKELLGSLATHHYRNNNMMDAAICATALRHLSPIGHSNPGGPDDPGSPHDSGLHIQLNALFGMQPPTYIYQAADSLLDMLTRELTGHGVANSSSSPAEAR